MNNDWVNVNPNEMMVVSKAYADIEKEWRFFVSGDEIVTGSLYHSHGMLEFKDYDEKDRKDAEVFAKQMAELIHKNKPDMDGIYVLDVCKVDGKYKIMELNAASCSGFYHCDVGKIVDKMNELAIKEYEEMA